MLRRFPLAAVGLGVGLAQERPQLNADGVVENPPGLCRPFKPGIEVSIYGRNLGSETPCSADAGRSDVNQLCGTAVTVGGSPAALLYVQEKQIYLRVPFHVPTEGPLPFIVTREGRASPAVAAQFGAYRAAITLLGIASEDMPVWIEVQLPEPLNHSLRYPVTIRPAGFGGHQFAVRRNGILIPPTAPRRGLPVAESILAIAKLGGPGSVCTGSLLGLRHEPKSRQRLPLHLLYRFDRPGTYEVRCVGYDFRYPAEKNMLVESPVESLWIQIDVRPTPPRARRTWLDAMRSDTPGDPVEWLSDYLPSLLVVPDAAVLPLLTGAVYHPNNLVRQYTLYARTCWITLCLPIGFRPPSGPTAPPPILPTC